MLSSASSWKHMAALVRPSSYKSSMSFRVFWTGAAGADSTAWGRNWFRKLNSVRDGPPASGRGRITANGMVAGVMGFVTSVSPGALTSLQVVHALDLATRRNSNKTKKCRRHTEVSAAGIIYQFENRFLDYSMMTLTSRVS